MNWISIEDRLPRHLDVVLVVNSWGRMAIDQYSDFGEDGGLSNGFCEICVTHWMPLPELPKES